MTKVIHGNVLVTKQKCLCYGQEWDRFQSAADGHENLPSWAPTIPLIDVEPGSQRVRLRARQSKFDAAGSSQDSEPYSDLNCHSKAGSDRSKCCQYQPIVKKWKWADPAVKVCIFVAQHLALKILVLKSKVSVHELSFELGVTVDCFVLLKN